MFCSYMCVHVCRRVAGRIIVERIRTRAMNGTHGRASTHIRTDKRRNLSGLVLAGGERNGERP